MINSKTIRMTLINRLSGILYPFISQSKKDTFYGQLLATEFFPDKSITINGFIEACLLKEFRKNYNATNPSPYFRNIIRNKVWGGNTGQQWHLVEAQADATLDKYGIWRNIQLQALLDFLQAHPTYTQIVEIGCGNGLYLHQISQRLNDKYTLIGIDLSAEQINWNKTQYPSIRFETGAAGEIELNPKDGGILYLTFGTLSCFTENELRIWLNQISNASGNQAVCISEWNADFDPEKNYKSEAMSPTLYNHAYKYLVEQAGLKIEKLEYTDASDIYPGYVRTLIIGTNNK